MKTNFFALNVTVIILTVTILLFPIDISCNYASVESVRIFGDRLLLFAILYFAWFVFLICTKNFRSNGLFGQGVFVACISSLVLIGFWTVVTHGNLFSEYSMAQAKFIKNSGSIPFDNNNFIYVEFPGTDLIALFLSEISGINLFGVRTLFIFLNIMEFSILMYLFYLNFLKNSDFAILSFLFLLYGNSWIVRSQGLYGGFVGFTFLSLFIFMLTLHRNTSNEKLLIAIIFAAFIKTYLPGATLCLFILATLYLIKHLQGIKGVNLISFTLLVSCLTIYLFSLLYTALRMQVVLKDFLITLLMDIFQGELLSRFFNPLRIAYSGVRDVDLWVVVTNYFWFIFNFFSTFLGVIFSIKHLFSRNSSHIRIGVPFILVGGFLGTLLFSTLSFVVNTSQIHRFQMYLPFFSIPIMMKFLIASEKNRGRIKALFILILLLSLPTFLGSSNLQKHISTIYITHTYEHYAGCFLERIFGTGEGLTVFMENQYQYGIMPYYVPRATYISEKEGAYASVGASSERLQRIIINLIDEFKKLERAIFIFSPRSVIDAQLFFGLSPDSVFWLKIKNDLGSRNQVYNNGYVKFYYSRD